MTVTTELEQAIESVLKSKGVTHSVEVPWPQSSPELGTPIQAWLSDLNLLETNDGVDWKHTPFDSQAITAGVTTISKVTASGVGLSGLMGSLVAYFKGWSASTTADWVLLACATLLIAVTVLAIAIIVRGDLAARAVSTAAQYQARADAARAFLGIIKPSEHTANGQTPGP